MCVSDPYSESSGNMSCALFAVVFVAVSLTTSQVVSGGKVLVFPLDGSHWLNMNLLLRGLHARGHEVTVVRSSTSWYIMEQAPHYRSITITQLENAHLQDEGFFNMLLAKMLALQRQQGSMASIMKFYWEMGSALAQIHKDAALMVERIFENKTLMQNLHDTQFDLVLIDPGVAVGVLVAHELKLPTVYNVRWITTGEGHFLVAPSPTSYVPVPGNLFSDKMDFGQRIKNMLVYLFNAFTNVVITCPPYNRLVERYFGPDVSFYHLLQGADIWLMRGDFIFEFPRPTMANVVYIGGFQCKPSEPLPSELEEFVQSSGKHGFIVMSLGSLVKSLPLEITSEIAAAFSQIPQKVIWRYEGERPNHLGNNTLLVKWLPQNDLLGHPKVRAFVSHCGTNGIYESIYHGVPIIGIPLMFDQFENAFRVEVRGAAKVVEAVHITSQSFLEVVQEVLHNPSYRRNMKRLSALHRDTPVPPLETALFWIEYVMRHKGASHLRTESFKMPWYSYSSVDVLCFLLAVSSLLTAITVGLIRYLCLRVCSKRKSKQE